MKELQKQTVTVKLEKEVKNEIPILQVPATTITKEINLI